VRALDDPGARRMISPSQGVHIVLERAFLPGDTAIMVPKTDDGRVLFAIPWHDRVLVGTTDTPVADVALEPRPLPEEVAFLLEHAARYLVRDPRPADVLSTFAGLRPLVGGEEQGAATSELSRDHTLSISESGLVTIAGGKWTTYRRMAEATVDQAATIAGLPDRPCPTRELHIHGWIGDTGSGATSGAGATSGSGANPGSGSGSGSAALAEYGADAPALRALIAGDARYARQLHPRLPYLAGEVVWAAREEMARTVEDVLSRRTRALVLDARASVAMAPAVAALLAEETGRDAAWADAQVAAYARLAEGYLPA